MTLQKIIRLPLILLIKFYQKCISPLMPNVCRYQPTCSQYMIEAIEPNAFCVATRGAEAALIRFLPKLNINTDKNLQY